MPMTAEGHPQFWCDRPVLVTGGASFIGSHLTDVLVGLGARVRVVDDLSSGRAQNIDRHIKARRIDFVSGDLRNAAVLDAAVAGIDTVFHLAAIHGGRGFVDTHQADCSDNVLIDGLTFAAAARHAVRKIAYASSGCVYPLFLQGDTRNDLRLTEEMVGPPYEPDGMYGWAKLTGELTFQALHDERGMKAVSCRYFTVYGPRGVENHAISAMFARAHIRQNPFEIWGDGTQVREMDARV